VSFFSITSSGVGLVGDSSRVIVGEVHEAGIYLFLVLSPFIEASVLCIF
jgi:hypothetical protein